MRPAMVEKQKTIDLIAKQINDSKTTIVVQYQGMNVEEISSLRKELRAKGATFTIYKNNLVARALKKEYSSLESSLVGPNGFIFGFENDLETAKIVSNYAKINKLLVLRGGIFEGKVIDQIELQKIASLPLKLELISMLASCLQAPVRNLALAIKAVAQQKENA
ncbi:50S ribosomal protein L10 [Spiroplasma endosymbiont of Danaus chrysippus]|uniref:50S ribosomal protein L10 n=1 Tax=Spiroplasma endosymbiont of Danaus chrysippus TaxID=2691041 RepID=UPI00157B8A9E|nr:50S ribosomal protein L10 [Spiroplasma endosymbiont of Danaus chrysippus]